MAASDVVHVRLAREDDRVVAAGAVGPDEQEQVREARRSSAPRYARGLPCQASPSVCPSRPRTAREAGVVVDLEAGAEDDRVELALGAVGGHDRARADLADRLGHDLGVRRGERGVVGVGHRDPLAAERVARASASPAARGPSPGGAGAGGRSPRTLEDSRRFDDRPEHGRPRARGRWPARTSRCVAGSAPEQPRARTAVIAAVGVGQDPRGRALEQVQLADAAAGSRGTNWTADAPVPITATRSPLEVVVVVPARRVEHRALEAVEARDVGRRGLAQAAHRADQHVRAQRAVRGLEPPARGVLVPRRARRPRGRSGRTASRRSRRRSRRR